MVPDAISSYQNCTTKVYSVPKGIFFISGYLQKDVTVPTCTLAKIHLRKQVLKNMLTKNSCKNMNYS